MPSLNRDLTRPPPPGECWGIIQLVGEPKTTFGEYVVAVYADGLDNDFTALSVATDFAPPGAGRYKANDKVWLFPLDAKTSRETGLNVQYGISPWGGPPDKNRQYPGQVRSGSGSNYVCDVYFDGLDTPATTNIAVTQLQISAGVNVPADVWVMVTRNLNDAGEPVYYMQFPTVFIEGA